MALIHCPECNKEISDQAEICTHCGFPVKDKNLYESKKWKFAVCMHCGHMPDAEIYGKDCRFCKSNTFKYIPYKTNINQNEYFQMNFFEKQELKNNVLENVIKKSPEFSQEAMDRRLLQNREEIRELARSNSGLFSSKSSASCPYCNSSNTRKISTGSRLLSTGFFGLGSSKIGKNYHCNSCGSDF